MAKPLAALDYLNTPGKHPALPVCVLFGEENFLKQHCLAEIRNEVLAGSDGEFCCTEFEGDEVELRQVFDELSTVAMFGGGRRLVIVSEADKFVSTHRPRLEDYVQNPLKSGVLVLEVKTWASTTRLYKALAETGLQIDCDAPTPAILLKWLTSWAKKRHQAALPGDAAEQLVEMLGPEMGLLDQELAKLTLLADPSPDGKGLPIITTELVRNHVGGWRAQTAWVMLDAAADGNAREAMRHLDRLLASGEAPISLLGQIASSLRRFTAATRIYQQATADNRKIPLSSALEQAGVKNWRDTMQKAERQIMQLGRERSGQMLRWLLEADLALKGTSSAPRRARFVLEQLIARMAKTGK